MGDGWSPLWRGEGRRRWRGEGGRPLLEGGMERGRMELD